MLTHQVKNMCEKNRLQEVLSTPRVQKWIRVLLKGLLKVARIFLH